MNQKQTDEINKALGRELEARLKAKRLKAKRS